MQNRALKFVSGITVSIKEEIKAHLLVEVDGNDMDVMMKDVEHITEVMEKFECDEILFADTEEQKQNLWRLRRNVAEEVLSGMECGLKT